MSNTIFKSVFTFLGHEVGVVERTRLVVRVSDEAPLGHRMSNGKFVFAGFGAEGPHEYLTYEDDVQDESEWLMH